MKERPHMYVKYSKDYPYLVEAYGDTVKELAEQIGVRPATISQCIMAGSKMYAKVYLDETEDKDNGK